MIGHARVGPRREAVSNRIEKLVLKGDLSRKQADRMHELAQGLYDRILEKLEDCDVEACLDCKDRFLCFRESVSVGI